MPIDLDQGQTQVITFTAKVLRKKAGEIFNRALVTHESVPELNVESNEVKTVVEEEPEPTPTEPEDKPDEPEPMPTEPEDKPDEPGVPNTAERENDDRFFMNSGGGKFDNQKRSTQGKVKQKELTRVAKSNTKNIYLLQECEKMVIYG
ncbi:hypothetical protein CIRMBP1310_02010 [Enterococcus cecorum]|uniref:hypothetical protein n=1 Tax=Enterococcus cecorum TaxID=44008 RepID=UPI000B2A7718|nr:hypothetical protein [Enterococcus cecorum]CAI3328532.1 hypothetical protein CIRMBP1302_00283 [Enterococcus cecorum]CAI3355338.1 hypothetical protein CIRMBP1298_00573 [Enterococcus cecorum]CAI3394303.1 hypothetical protein CIRMBP1238_01509 [Enterococcus cecorum]CAI3407054.1 hypothetical protein CIRMBP1214_01686 [Enterococcus cecorum]CAI3409901.1 hypothetical protein CIRMBP1251_01556 [Enterococcus cecorum]